VQDVARTKLLRDTVEPRHRKSVHSVTSSNKPPFSRKPIPEAPKPTGLDVNHVNAPPATFSEASILNSHKIDFIQDDCQEVNYDEWPLLRILIPILGLMASNGTLNI
jgi:hypothetical protein